LHYHYHQTSAAAPDQNECSIDETFEKEAWEEEMKDPEKVTTLDTMKAKKWFNGWMAHSNKTRHYYAMGRALCGDVSESVTDGPHDEDSHKRNCVACKRVRERPPWMNFGCWRKK